MLTKTCQRCQDRYYLNNGLCVNLPENCDQVTSTGICVRCVEGYEIREGKCQLALVIANCNNIDYAN